MRIKDVTWGIQSARDPRQRAQPSRTYHLTREEPGEWDQTVKLLEVSPLGCVPLGYDDPFASDPLSNINTL